MSAQPDGGAEAQSSTDPGDRRDGRHGALSQAHRRAEGVVHDGSGGGLGVFGQWRATECSRQRVRNLDGRVLLAPIDRRWLGRVRAADPGVDRAHRGGADEPAEQPADDADPERTRAHSRRSEAGYITGPMIQGANSSSPTPDSSLLERLPEAIATISSKI